LSHILFSLLRRRREFNEEEDIYFFLFAFDLFVC